MPRPRAAQPRDRQASRPNPEEIAARDRALFAAVFDTCDTATLATLVTDDFEMYHDKGGLTATSGAQFISSIEGMCARQKTGTDYRARRELVPDRMKVYPLSNYGAVQVGVWKRDATGWKLSRVLSYDHKLVGQEGADD